MKIDNLLIDKDNIDKDLFCSICNNLLIDNRQGHVFCYQCINSWLLKSNSCPTCRKEIKSIDYLSKNRFVDKAIEKLKIYCPYRFEKNGNEKDDLITDHFGCLDILTIEELKSHLENCKKKFVKCKNENCKLELRLYFLESHLNQECDFTLFKCKYNCGNQFERYIIDNHEDNECPFGIIKCTNLECNETIKRNQLNEHLESICKFTEIECDYKDGGCDEKFERFKKDEHISTINHNPYINKIIKDQKLLQLETIDQLSKLKIEFNDFKVLKSKEIHYTNKLVNDQVIKIESLTQELNQLKTKSSKTTVYLFPDNLLNGKTYENDCFYYKLNIDGLLSILSKSNGKGRVLFEAECFQTKNKKSIFSSYRKEWIDLFDLKYGMPLDRGYFSSSQLIIKVTNLD